MTRPLDRWAVPIPRDVRFRAIVAVILAAIMLSGCGQFIERVRAANGEEPIPTALPVEYAYGPWSAVDVTSGTTLLLTRANRTTLPVVLVGLEAPEGDDQACWAANAEDRLRDMVTTREPLWIEYDTSQGLPKDGQRGTFDSQGRAYVYLWIGDSFMVNVDQLQSGFTVATEPGEYPYRRQVAFAALTNTAKEAKTGAFSEQPCRMP